MSELQKALKTFKRDPIDASWTPATAIALAQEKQKCKDSAIALLEKMGGDADSDEGAEFVSISQMSCVRNASVMNPILASVASLGRRLGGHSFPENSL